MPARLRLLTLAVPIAALGALSAHAVGYRLAEPSAAERDALLAESGHAYFTQAWLALLAVLVLGLGVELVLGFVYGPVATHVPRWPFLLVAPGGFLIQEHGERLLAGASIASTPGEPAVLLGLVLQVPFALATWLLARLVLGISSALGAARIETRPPSPRSDVSLPCPAPFGGRPRGRVLTGSAAPRAPPPILSIG